MLTGETGGTGQTSTANNLSKELEVPKVANGAIFRAFADQFEIFQKKHPRLSRRDQYIEFREKYQNAYDNGGIDAVKELLRESMTKKIEGPTVTNFNTALEDFGEGGETDPLWDTLVEQITIEQALQKPKLVWEGKLAILALQIDQFAYLTRQQPDIALPFMRVLLKVPSNIAADRISQREGGREVDEQEEVINRARRDFRRYGDLYTIGGKPVNVRDLAQAADIVIDTAHNNERAVKLLVIQEYINRLETIRSELSSIVVPLLGRLNQKLHGLRP